MNTFFIGMHFLPWRLLASFSACSPTVAQSARGVQPHHALQPTGRVRRQHVALAWCDTACRHRFAWVQTHWIFINFLMEIYKSITSLKSHPIHDGIRDTSGEQTYICHPITFCYYNCISVRNIFPQYDLFEIQRFRSGKLGKQINKQCEKIWAYFKSRHITHPFVQLKY